MKKFIFGLSLLLVIISIYCEPGEKEVFEFFKKKGFGDSDELTKDQFVDMVEFLLTKTVDPQEAEKLGFRPFIPKHCGHVPEKFKKDDINKYITEDLLMNIMFDFVDDKYPEAQAEMMKKQIYDMAQSKNAKKKQQEEKKDDL